MEAVYRQKSCRHYILSCSVYIGNAFQPFVADLAEGPVHALAQAATRRPHSGAAAHGRNRSSPLSSRPMVTLGVDLASRPERTATCRIRWRTASAVVDVDTLSKGATDSRLLELFRGADKIGIDAPFGWPASFVQAIHGYSTSTVWPNGDISDLRFRRTDRVARERLGRWPLSVSADRIAMIAMRAARLLAEVADDGEVIDRSGSGRFVETYPAAALSVWGLPSKGYRGTEEAAIEVRGEIVDGLTEKIGSGLTLTDEVQCECRKSDDILDALVAALVARTAARGRCEPILPEDCGLAKTEGWIALPHSDSLEKLV